jgi:hypothetical protein
MPSIRSNFSELFQKWLPATSCGPQLLSIIVSETQKLLPPRFIYGISSCFSRWRKRWNSNHIYTPRNLLYEPVIIWYQNGKFNGIIYQILHGLPKTLSCFDDLIFRKSVRKTFNCDPESLRNMMFTWIWKVLLIPRANEILGTCHRIQQHFEEPRVYQSNNWYVKTFRCGRITPMVTYCSQCLPNILQPLILSDDFFERTQSSDGRQHAKQFSLNCKGT